MPKLSCVCRYRRFNVLGTAVKALNMAESQNGRMVADFRHLVRPEGSRSSTTAARAEASVFLLQTLKEQKSGGGKGGSDVSRPSVWLPVQLVPRIFTITLCVSVCV